MEKQALVANGKNVKFNMKVEDISASVSDEGKKRIEENLVEEQQIKAKVSNYLNDKEKNGTYEKNHKAAIIINTYSNVSKC